MMQKSFECWDGQEVPQRRTQVSTYDSKGMHFMFDYALHQAQKM